MRTARPSEPDRRLRLGLVTHYMLPHVGGIETQAEAIFRAYSESGAEVRWVASRCPRQAPAREAGRIRVACNNLLEEHLGVPWPIWGWEGIRAIAELVRWADAVHVHDCLYLGSVFGVLLARRAGKPAIVSQHIGFVEYSSAALNGIETLAYRQLGKRVLGAATRVVCCTPAAEEFVERLLPARAEARCVIPYGTDTRSFRPPSVAERIAARTRLGVASDRPVVLFVGRLVEKKGVLRFLEVCRRMPAHEFVMVGDGPLRSAIPSDLGNLKWLGGFPATEMPLVYQGADIFLLPSHGEGFPLAIHEAMASGLPVIAPRGEAFAPVLDREGACLVADLDPPALCEAVRRLTEGPSLAASIGERAAALVDREWSARVMGSRYLELLRGLVDANGRGGGR